MLMMLPASAQMMPSLADEPKFHDHEVKYSKKKTSFQLMTDTDAQEVKINIYDTALGGSPIRTETMIKLCKSPIINDKSLLWCAIINEDLKGKFYTFNVKQNDQWLGETPGIKALAVGAHRTQVRDEICGRLNQQQVNIINQDQNLINLENSVGLGGSQDENGEILISGTQIGPK